jgi:hypothetical protein
MISFPETSIQINLLILRHQVFDPIKRKDETAK